MATRGDHAVHVLALPFPAQGHINPLMRLCQLLADRGDNIQITFINIEPIHDRIIQANQQVADNQYQNINIRTVKFRHASSTNDQDNNDDDVSSHTKANSSVIKDFRVSLRTLVDAVHGLAPALRQLIIDSRSGNGTCPFTCVICDVFASSTVEPLAREFGLPWLAMYPSCQARHLISLYVLRGLISIDQVLEARCQQANGLFCEDIMFPGLPILHNIDIPMYTHMVDDTKFIYETGNHECRIAFEMSNGIIINTFEALEGQALAVMRSLVRTSVYSVGPLVQKILTSLWREENHCLDWLDTQPPQSVLYISFGTIAILSRAQFVEIIQGLQSCKQRFLWVLRLDLVEGVDLNEYNGEYGLGYFVTWAPQIDVLSHHAIGGFLSHCGWNSTMEAITHGVPLICWPYFGDQHIIAKYIVEEWRIGMRLFPLPSSFSKVFVSQSQVEKVLKSFVEGDEGQLIRRNIYKLKGASEKSKLVGGTSNKMLHDLSQLIEKERHSQINT